MIPMAVEGKRYSRWEQKWNETEGGKLLVKGINSEGRRWFHGALPGCNFPREQDTESGRGVTGSPALPKIRVSTLRLPAQWMGSPGDRRRESGSLRTDACPSLRRTREGARSFFQHQLASVTTLEEPAATSLRWEIFSLILLTHIP